MRTISRIPSDRLCTVMHLRYDEGLLDGRREPLEIRRHFVIVFRHILATDKASTDDVSAADSSKIDGLGLIRTGDLCCEDGGFGEQMLFFTASFLRFARSRARDELTR